MKSISTPVDELKLKKIIDETFNKIDALLNLNPKQQLEILDILENELRKAKNISCNK